MKFEQNKKLRTIVCLLISIIWGAIFAAMLVHEAEIIIEHKTTTFILATVIASIWIVICSWLSSVKSLIISFGVFLLFIAVLPPIMGACAIKYTNTSYIPYDNLAVFMSLLLSIMISPIFSRR